jgi:hypothetical protein
MRITYLLPALTSAALLLSGTTAIAHQTAPATATAEEAGGTAPAVKPKKERKICRDAGNSYSHMQTRVCKTQAEWDNNPGAREIDSHVTSGNPNR